MPILLGLIAAILGWALWTRRIRPAQLIPAIVAIAGAAIAIKGQILGGIGLLVVGLAWFAGARRPGAAVADKNQQLLVEQARDLLGVGIDADAEAIRAAHRRLISDNHPDMGGDGDRAARLNDARDLLLAAIKTPQR